MKRLKKGLKTERYFLNGRTNRQMKIQAANWDERVIYRLKWNWYSTGNGQGGGKEIALEGKWKNMERTK